MNYDDDWFWDNENSPDPMTPSTKVFIVITAFVALALIVWAILD